MIKSGLFFSALMALAVTGARAEETKKEDVKVETKSEGPAGTSQKTTEKKSEKAVKVHYSKEERAAANKECRSQKLKGKALRECREKYLQEHHSAAPQSR